jgi:hypothetical protein
MDASRQQQQQQQQQARRRGTQYQLQQLPVPMEQSQRPRSSRTQMQQQQLGVSRRGCSSSSRWLLGLSVCAFKNTARSCTAVCAICVEPACVCMLDSQ